MAQIILTFGLGKEKIKVVRSIAQKNRIQIKEISRKDYNQKLGALAGIQGFAKEKAIYNGPDFPPAVPAVSSDRVLPVFRSFGSRILRTDRFLPGRLQTDWCSDSSLKSNHYSSKYFLDRRSTLQRIMERAPAFSS